MSCFLFVQATGWFAFLIFCLVAASGQAAPALPGDSCQVEPRPVWSETEAWVWSRICIGEIADLNAHFGRDLDPRLPAEWIEGRKLSAAFLETILLHDPWRAAVRRQGVRIVGAWFEETVDLEDANIVHPLWLDASRFALDLNLSRLRGRSALSLEGSFVNGTLGLSGAEIEDQITLTGTKVTDTLNMDSADISQNLFMHSNPEQRTELQDVILRGAKVAGQVTLAGAKLAGTLNMDAVEIGGHLLLRSTPEQRADFKGVILNDAKVGRQVDLTGAKVAGTLNMNDADIGQSLFMHSTPERRAEFDDVFLRGVKVGGQVTLSGAKVTNTLNMDSAEIGENLYMNGDPEHRAEFNEVILSLAKVSGHIILVGAKVASALDMDSIDIGQSLFMRSMPEQRAEFDGGVDLVFARIGSNLDVRGAALSSVDLTGTMIKGEFRLASRSRGLPRWAAGGRLNLRNVTVDALQDEPEAWPQELDLDGFTYRRLGGFDSDPGVDVAARGSAWFVDWLARDQPFTPQPYEQLATVLREMGHGEEANDVLFAGRERARERAWDDGHWQSWIGLTLLKLTVGYGLGYRYFWTLYWVIGLVLVATIVLGIFGQNQRPDGKTIGIWYSLDMLLPIVQLRPAHHDIDLGIARYYFYIHKIMGYVLASFLIAGMAGLTE